MPSTYLSTLAAFTHFLTAYTHTLLYLRTLYPRTSFARSRFHNTPVYQSRHPLVCEWLHDAIAAVRNELLSGTISRIAIVIYSCSDANGARGGSGSDIGHDKGSVSIMERYMLDVSAFPVVQKGDQNREIEWDDATPAADEEAGNAAAKPKQKGLGVDEDVDVNLSEQFRAALVALTSRCAQLAPLPPHCSFNISMELKDEGDVDPPLHHPQPWIPVQPSLQKTGRRGAEREEQAIARREGEDLGGAKVTPVRTVEAGVFRFETWIEEGKAKFDMLDKGATSSLASSGG